ncbi:MAG TPA: hypothetical protein VLG12_04925 [Candidatus Saccharimonadales bacterium]|nr:hypothetical protein [Candidatus Saccharimonadales bacterium]
MPEILRSIAELESSSYWNYQQFTDRIRKAVYFYENISPEELPDQINFGEIAEMQQALVTLRASNPEDNEHYQVTLAVGIENRDEETEEDLLLLFSKRGYLNKFNEGTQGDDPVIKTQMLHPLVRGVPIVLHDHPIPSVLSVGDLVNLQMIEGMQIVIGVGTPGDENQKGFMMFAISTTKTDVISSQEIENRFYDSETATMNSNELLKFMELRNQDKKEIAKQREKEKLQQNPELFNKLHQIIIDNPMDLLSLSNEEIQNIEVYRDEALREEATLQGIAIYLMSLDGTIGYKCDLSKPLLPQLH